MNSFLKLLCAAPGCWLLGCGLFSPSADPSYAYASTAVYDAAKLIKLGQFEDTDLLKLFGRFVQSECRGHKLARLIVSPNRWDLTSAFNVSFPEANPAEVIRKGLFRLHFGKPTVAQVWCFENQATVTVRRGEEITHYQLKGDRSAQELEKNGVSLMLVGANLRAGWPASNSAASERPTDTIWLYVRAMDLPKLDIAESIHEELEKETGTATFLILRTDSFFVEYDGPAWDIFAKSLPEGSATKFLDKPHIVCPPKRTGGRCLIATSPPSAPAEAWGKSTKIGR